MKRIVGLAAAGVMGAMLSGCIIVDADVKADDWNHGGYGYVMGANVDARSSDITVTFASNGCTNKEDFDTTIKGRGDGHYDVGFRRRQPDRCRSFAAEGRSLTWSFSELGLPRDARVMILNPVGR